MKFISYTKLYTLFSIQKLLVRNRFCGAPSDTSTASKSFLEQPGNQSAVNTALLSARRDATQLDTTQLLDMPRIYLMRNTIRYLEYVSHSPLPRRARTAKVPPGFFASMNDDVWMLAGHRGLGKGFHCCALPWRTEPTRPAGERPS